MVRLVDDAFSEHGLQRFHAVPRPHFSAAWVEGDAQQALLSALRELGGQRNDSVDDSGGGGDTGCVRVAEWGARVTRVMCRIGKQVSCVWDADKA